METKKNVNNDVGPTQQISGKAVEMMNGQKAVKFNQPLSRDVLPQSSGICTMMRLPLQETTADLDACFIGVPVDIGAGYKNGARFGPRYIRIESAQIYSVNTSTGAAPFDSLQVADAGDVRVNQYDLAAACDDVRRHFSTIECIPLTMGGDHTITFPILQAMKKKHGPVALIQIDAHTDTTDTSSGSKLSHSTAIRRAAEDGCVITNKTFQIGTRGTTSTLANLQWGLDQGFRVVRAQDCWYKSMAPLMKEVRDVMGDTPVYLSFDMDSLDPSHAPGTGSLEFGGLTSMQALEIIRCCRGLNIIGAEIVELLPTYDVRNNVSSAMAATLLYEMLCVLPGVKYHPI